MTTFGIDLASPQAGLDFAAATRAGVRAAYVKLGGDNVSRYVAPHYAAEVDKARAQGWIVGHYWVPGPVDPIGAADYFVDHLRNVDRRRDFFVLDDETLDQGRLYEPADAAHFLARVQQRLGVQAKQLFLYVGSYDLRARVWREAEGLGAQLIIASYGANTGIRDHEPNTGGAFGGIWGGHQYTSNGKIGGTALDLDLFADWAFNYISSAPPSVDPASPGGTTPITPIVEDFMATLSDAEKTDLFDTLHDISKELGAGNARKWTDAQASGLSVSGRLDALASKADAIQKAIPSAAPTTAEIKQAIWWDQTIARTGADGKVTQIPAIQELADAKTNTISLITNGVSIDAATLASKLAPLIKVTPGASGPTIEQITAAIQSALSDLTLVPKTQ